MDYRTLPPPVAALERRLGMDEGTLDGADKARAEDALLDAAGLILHEAGTRADSWEVNAPRVAVTICLKAARREWDNPEGFTQEGLGEHSATVSNASGVYLTDAEKRTLREAAGRVGYTGTLRIPSAYGYGHPDIAITPTAYPDGTDGGPIAGAA